MVKKTKNILFYIFFLVFVGSITKYYFSEKNILITNKSRSSYSKLLNDEKINLPILKNDTNDIITYKDELSEFRKKRKKRFWEKLISN